jgi:hypothetical protein
LKNEEFFSVVFLPDVLTSAQELSKTKERYMLLTIVVDAIVVMNKMIGVLFFFDFIGSKSF